MLISKVLFKNKDAIGVTGVRNGKEINFYANKEVILCAGSFNSPKILQLSGIGPKDILDEFNIENISVLKGVGKNLQDHYNGRIVFKTSNQYTLNAVMKSKFKSIREGLKIFFIEEVF